MSTRQLMAVMVACGTALAGVACQTWAGSQGGSLSRPSDITGYGMVEGSDLGLFLSARGDAFSDRDDVGGVTDTGSTQASRLEPGGIADVGATTVTSGGCTGEVAWLPTFGGAPGVSNTLRAMTVFDDGLGGGPALYAGGGFAGSPAGDSFVAKWGCTVTAAPCPADLNGDGTVDISDLFAVLALWGACDGCPEDLTGDGTIDLLDLLQVIGAWGECS